jgi:hypothetical protein
MQLLRTNSLLFKNAKGLVKENLNLLRFFRRLNTQLNSSQQGLFTGEQHSNNKKNPTVRTYVLLLSLSIEKNNGSLNSD